MLKASNNNFGTISKIKIPKIGFFCNLKSAKVAKKMWKNIFSTNFGRLNMHKTFTSNILILLFKNATPFKINAKKVIIIQNMLEFEIKKN